MEGHAIATVYHGSDMESQHGVALRFKAMPWRDVEVHDVAMACHEGP